MCGICSGRSRPVSTSRRYSVDFSSPLLEIPNASSFPSGDGVTVPKTTWLRYTMAAYNTYDAQLGFAKDAWDFTIYGTNLSNSNASTFTTSGQDVKAEYPLVPRVIGLKVGLHF